MGVVVRGWWTLVQFGFRLLYNEMSFAYDAVSYIVSFGEWRAWQRSTLTYVMSPSMRVLELAHGTGNLHLDLFAMGVKPIGYDLSPAMGKIASRKLKARGYKPQLVRGMAQRMPFLNYSFDIVISTFPTNFIIAEETLRDIHRILAQDGNLVIVLNGVLDGGGLVRGVLELLYRVTGQREEAKWDIESYFGKFGFQAKYIEVVCKRSTTQLIVARKN